MLRTLFVCLIVAWAPVTGAQAADRATAPDLDTALDPVTAAGLNTPDFAAAVREAFAATHRGLSTDALLANDALLTAFDTHWRTRWADLDPAGTNPDHHAPAHRDAATYAGRWMLLRLRKTGKLNVPTTARVHADPSAPPRSVYAPAAEIAARLTLDRFSGSLDAVLCDPPRRAHFDAQAQRLSADIPGIHPTLLRAAALGLRKARRLRPELTVRIADWGRTLTTHAAADLIADPQRIPRVPGVYLFRNAQGYLYIGEAKDLRIRLTQHLSGEGQPALTTHLGEADLNTLTVELHAFAPDSNARLAAHRRAYESELIHTRQPKFNVRP